MTDVLPAVADGADVLARGGALTGGIAAVGEGWVAPVAGLAPVGEGPPVAGAFGGVAGVVGVDAARSDEFSGGGTGGTVVPDGFGPDDGPPDDCWPDGEGPPDDWPPDAEPPDDGPPDDC
jgi:hypothetical protein